MKPFTCEDWAPQDRKWFRRMVKRHMRTWGYGEARLEEELIRLKLRDPLRWLRRRKKRGEDELREDRGAGS